MNCRTCNRPCRVVAHNLERCPDGHGEWWYDGTHWLWRRTDNGGRFDGEVVTIDGDKYRLVYEGKAE